MSSTRRSPRPRPTASTTRFTPSGSVAPRRRPVVRAAQLPPATDCPTTGGRRRPPVVVLLTILQCLSTGSFDGSYSSPTRQVFPLGSVRHRHCDPDRDRLPGRLVSLRQ